MNIHYRVHKWPPANGHYRKPHAFSPHYISLFRYYQFQYYYTAYRYLFQVISTLQALQPK
jgi:hypothetical protein